MIQQQQESSFIRIYEREREREKLFYRCNKISLFLSPIHMLKIYVFLGKISNQIK